MSKRLLNYNKKISDKTFSKDDIPGLFKDLTEHDVDEYGEKIQEVLMKRIGKIKKQVAEYFGCKTSEIITSYPPKKSNQKSYKIVLGDAYLTDENGITKVDDELRFVLGNVFVRSDSIKTLNHILFIGGKLDIAFSENFKSFGDLKHVKGNLVMIDPWSGRYHGMGDYFPTVDGLALLSPQDFDNKYRKYEENQKEQSRLTATDIGKIGFGASVDECDSIEMAIKSLIERNEEKVI